MKDGPARAGARTLQDKIRAFDSQYFGDDISTARKPYDHGTGQVIRMRNRGQDRFRVVCIVVGRSAESSTLTTVPDASGMSAMPFPYPAKEKSGK